MSLGKNFEEFLRNMLKIERDERGTDQVILHLREDYPVMSITGFITQYSKDTGAVLEKETDGKHEVSGWVNLTCCEVTIIIEMNPNKEGLVSRIELDYV